MMLPPPGLAKTNNNNAPPPLPLPRPSGLNSFSANKIMLSPLLLPTSIIIIFPSLPPLRQPTSHPNNNIHPPPGLAKKNIIMRPPLPLPRPCGLNSFSANKIMFSPLLLPKSIIIIFPPPPSPSAHLAPKQ